MSWPGLVLITGGGTGGHVFPGLATAEVLLEMGARVHWLGTRRGMEAILVPAAGIPISSLRVTAMRGKSAWERIVAPLLLGFAVLQAVWIIARLKPACVLGTGGFVAAPGGLAAWLLRRPLVIHEQNAVAGTTNRLLARFADRVLCGFPATFANHPARRLVGNPVRREIGDVRPPSERLHGRVGPLQVLVIGGSQGSMAINKAVAGALALMSEQERPSVWHQCGRVDYARCAEEYAELGVSVRLEPFIGAMQEAYDWAELAVCRAGALTVAEIAAAGVAGLFVPLPSAIDDHQSHNAAWLVDAGAALQVDETSLTPQWLADQWRQLSVQRPQLFEISKLARAKAIGGAADSVARTCRELAGGG